MKYVIFEMVQPSHLMELVQDGYCGKAVYRDVLERLDVPGVETIHPTMESAVNEIEKNVDSLKNLKLTILPIISVNWEGEFSEYF
jgi:hypothetical protein